MKKILLLFLTVTILTVAVVAFLANRETNRADGVALAPVAAKSPVKPAPVLPPETAIAQTVSSTQQAGFRFCLQT